MGNIRKDGRWVRVSMHRWLLGAQKGQFVDHIDGDGLNNQRSNIRICSPQDNSRYRRLNRVKKHSPYKGVALVKGKYWCARINLRRRGRSYEKHLGLFPTPEEAARAYNAAAREHFGEFAYLNPV